VGAIVDVDHDHVRPDPQHSVRQGAVAAARRDHAEIGLRAKQLASAARMRF